MIQNKILIECYNDEALCLALSADKSTIEHNIGGKGEILKKIKEREKCIAIIDNDKGTNDKYFKKSILHEKISDDIKVFYEKGNQNYIIVFYPRLETIIGRLIKNDNRNLNTAQNLGIKPDEKSLHDIGSNPHKLIKLKNLFEVLIQRNTDLKSLEKYFEI